MYFKVSNYRVKLKFVIQTLDKYFQNESSKTIIPRDFDRKSAPKYFK